MNEKTSTRKILKNIANILFVVALLLLIFSPGAKAWFLQQLLSAGLFKAEIKKEPTNANPSPINFSYQDEQGKVVSSGNLKDKVVFINFWATWCPPCRAEMPSLHKMYEELKNDDRIVFLFLNEDENIDKAKTFLEANHYSFPLTTRVGKIPGEIFTGTLPTTVVLNKEGKIVMKHEGIAGYNNGKFIQQLKSLL